MRILNNTGIIQLKFLIKKNSGDVKTYFCCT